MWVRGVIQEVVAGGITFYSTVVESLAEYAMIETWVLYTPELRHKKDRSISLCRQHPMQYISCVHRITISCDRDVCIPSIRAVFEPVAVGTTCGHFSEIMFGDELSSGMIDTVRSDIEASDSRLS